MSHGARRGSVTVRADTLPAFRTSARAAAANHHLLLAHGLAVPILAFRRGRCQSGNHLNLGVFRPGTEHEEDIAAAKRADGSLNRLFLDPVFQGSLSRGHARALLGPAPVSRWCVMATSRSSRRRSTSSGSTITSRAPSWTRRVPMRRARLDTGADQ